MPILSRKIITYTLACICAAAGFVGAYMSTSTRAADKQCKSLKEHCTLQPVTTTSETTTPDTTTSEGTTTTPETTTSEDTPTTTTSDVTTTTPTEGVTTPVTTTPAPVKSSRKVLKSAVKTLATSSETPSSTGSLSRIPGLQFDGDFESGSYTPWNKPQCANYGHVQTTRTFGNFSISSPGGQGNYDGQFAVPADSTHLTRCQVLTPRTVNVGADEYYSLMLYLPNGWSTGTNGFWGAE